MPVKKKKKTTKRKSQAKQTINRTVKKNIKNAVDQIPQMIVEGKENKKKQETDLKTDYLSNMKEYRWKQAIMWSGVIILAGAVTCMWFLNINATFFDVNKNINKSEEVKILNESTQKIKEIISDIDIQQNLKSLKIENINANQPVTNTAQFEALIKSINEITSSTQSTSTIINAPSSSTNQ